MAAVGRPRVGVGAAGGQGRLLRPPPVGGRAGRARRAYLETASFPGIEVSDRIRTERRGTSRWRRRSGRERRGGGGVHQPLRRHGGLRARRHRRRRQPGLPVRGGDPHRKGDGVPGPTGPGRPQGGLHRPEREPGWGGSPTIGGSPQGVSSVIPTDEIVRIVEEHLL